MIASPKPRPFAFLLLLAAACYLSSPLHAADVLEEIGGASHTGELREIREDGAVLGEGIPAGLELSALRSVQASIGAQADSPPAAALRVDLVGGLAIHASQAEIEGEKVRITEAGGVKLALPLTLLRGIVVLGDAESQYKPALAQPDANQDKVLLAAGEDLQVLGGLLESLDAKEAKFQWQGATHAVPRERFRGLVLASAGLAKKQRPLTVNLHGGSQLPAEAVTLAEGKLRLTLGGEASEIGWNRVESLAIRSDRWAYLSELQPSEVKEEPLLTLPRPWRADRSVAGEPLKLAGRVYAKGIGAHARSRLTFDLEPGHELLAGMAGIHAGGAKGDCELSVLGDGKTLWQQRVRAGEAPKPLQIDIRGVRRLTLVVEPGEDLDFGDHVDWCDVRVIRQP